MARYVNLSDNSAASGRDGTSPANYWNLADYISGTVVPAEGETIYLKGRTMAVITTVTKGTLAATYDRWGNSAWGGPGALIASPNSTVKSGLIGFTLSQVSFYYQHGTTFIDCIITTNRGGGYGAVFTSSVKFKNCIIDSFVASSSGYGITAEYESCLIFNAVKVMLWDGDIPLNKFIDCTMGVTSEQLSDSSFFPTNLVTVEAVDCTFVDTISEDAFQRYNSLGQKYTEDLLTNSGKALFDYRSIVENFSLYHTKEEINTIFIGNAEGDYSAYASGISPYGNPHKSRGTFWYRDTYYVNVASDTTGGNGSQSSPMGIIEFNEFVAGTRVIGGRSYQEGAEFILVGVYKKTTPLVFPRNDYETIPYFSNTYVSDNFASTEFRPIGEAPFYVDPGSDLVSWGCGNKFTQFVISQDNMVMNKNDFFSCIIFSEAGLNLSRYNDTVEKMARFYCSTIEVASITVTGDIPSSHTPLSFGKCLISGYGQVPTTITSEVVSGTSVQSVFYTDGGQTITGGPFTCNGKIYFRGSTDFDAYSSGSVFNDDAFFVKINPSDVARFEGNHTFNAKLYIDNAFELEPSSLSPAAKSVKVYGKSAFGTNASFNNLWGSTVTMFNDTAFNCDMIGNISNLNGHDFYYNGIIPNPVSKVSNWGHIYNNNSNISIPMFLDIDPSIIDRPSFHPEAIPVTNIVNWTAIDTDPYFNGYKPAYVNGMNGTYANRIWDYCSANGKLWNGYAVVKIDKTMTFASTGNLFDKKIIFLNSNHIQEQDLGGNEGMYLAASTSLTVIYTYPGATHEYIGPKTGSFYGYLRNDGSLIIGSQTKGIGTFTGALHDMSTSTTSWRSGARPTVLNYNNSVMLEMFELGLVKSSMWGGVSSVLNMSVTDCCIMSTKEQFVGGVDSNTINIIGDFHCVYSVAMSADLPTSFDFLKYKHKLTFSDYNYLNTLTTNGTSLEKGLWMSNREPNSAVGAFYFGAGSLPSTYYVDISSNAIGDGTQAAPFSHSQFKEYLSGSSAYWVVSGDTLFVRGRRILSPGERLVLSMVSKTGINIKAWDISTYGMWGYWSSSYDGSVIIELADSMNNCEIYIHDMIAFGYPGGEYLHFVKGVGVGAVDIRFFNCLVTSTGILHIAMGVNSSVLVKGCTLVSDAMFIATGYLHMFYTVLSADVSIGVSEYDSVSFVNSETNLPTSRVKYDATSVYDNLSVRAIPTGLSMSAYNEAYYMYSSYGIQNVPASPDWVAASIPTGIAGEPRAGIGAFWFTASDRVFYVDLGSEVKGDGTQPSPLTAEQFRNYFDPTVGSYSPAPYNNDTFYVKGVYFPRNDKALIRVNKRFSGLTVSVKPWDIAVNDVWSIDLSNYSGGHDYSFVESNVVDTVGRISVSGYAIMSPNGVGIRSLDAKVDPTSMTVAEFKCGIMHSARGVVNTDDIRLNTTSSHSGCSFVCDNIIFLNDSTSVSQCVIKAITMTEA